MTETPADRAVCFFAGGANCAQAVLAAFGSDAGLSHELCLSLAAGFGGGIGRTAGPCGAVTGAIMALGLREGNFSLEDQEAKAQLYASVRLFMERFAARQGSCLCRELLGCDISTVEGWELARAQNLHTTRCTNIVRDAADLLTGMLRSA